MLAPDQVALYERYLKAYADDASMWHALPRDVSAWWRERAETSPSRNGAGWQLTGTGARRARLAFAEPA